MARKRALKDAAEDPLVKKEPLIPEEKRERFNGKQYVLTIVAALVAGFLGGLISNRFFRFRF